jgi:hypothetical protein
MRIATSKAKQVRFVGEQCGTTEREFIVRILPILSDNGAVKRSYLARVLYDSPPEMVALCICGCEANEALVRNLGSVFSSMFGRDQNLDILFLSESQERELSKVCTPFVEYGMQ